MAVVSYSEFKGNAMIVLKRSEEDRFPFQFGLSKAKLMLEAADEIRAWVAKQEAGKPPSAGSGLAKAGAAAGAEE
jgi:hypothetical protein